MPVAKKHASNAARQAAQRARQREAAAELEREIGGLHAALDSAAASGNAQAELLRGATPRETIARLTAHYNDDAEHSRTRARDWKAATSPETRLAPLGGRRFAQVK